MLQAANWCEKTIKTAKLDVFRSQFLRMIERWDVVIFRRHSFFCWREDLLLCRINVRAYCRYS